MNSTKTVSKNPSTKSSEQVVKKGSITPAEIAEISEKSARNAMLALRWLKQAATTNPVYHGADFVNIARRFCEEVADWVEQCPTEAVEVAKKMPDWPVIHGRHFAIITETQSSLERLCLGDDHPVTSAIMAKRVVDPKTGKVRKRKGIDLSKPANRQAAAIFDAILQSRKMFLNDLANYGPGQMPQWRTAAQQLGPISPSTADEWFRVGWSGCNESGIIPEMMGAENKPLGHYRRFHKSTRSNLDQKTLKVRNLEEKSSITEGTKTRVRDAFLEMVKRTGK
jgi:hypothetical protein